MARAVTRTVIALACVGAVVAAVFLWAAPVLERLGFSGSVLPWTAECSVRDGEDAIELSLDQARLVTTAIAQEASGAVPDPAAIADITETAGTADTSDTADAADTADGSDLADIDPRAVELLAQGPDDAPGPTLTCSVSGSDDLEVEDMGASGLTPRAEHVLREMTEVFGDLSVGGFEPGGVDEGHGENSAHYEGRAIDVFFRPVNEENRREGWILTNWLVAHAGELDLDVIIFDDHIFSARLPQWRDYNSPDPDNEILRHLDHVHVDVRRGG